MDEVNREKTNRPRLRQEHREIRGLRLAFCPVSLPPGSSDAIRYRARGPLSLVLILVQQTVCRRRRRSRYSGVCCIVTSSYSPRRITFPLLHLVAPCSLTNPVLHCLLRNLDQLTPDQTSLKFRKVKFTACPMARSSRCKVAEGC